MKDKEKKYPWFRSIFKKKKDGPEEPVTDDVYAGPEFFEREGPGEPEIEDAVGPMECVYAGPEMADLLDPQTTVNGGPDMTPPPEPQMMTVYAGPEYFSGKSAFAGAPAPEPAEPDGPEGRKRCSFCGTRLGEDEKFCHECGTPVPSDD